MGTRLACECVVKNRQKDETQEQWLKRWMCHFHWLQTDYAKAINFKSHESKTSGKAGPTSE